MTSLATMSPTLSAVYSELVLSLYPILIKTVPTTLITQWLARFLTFPVLAYLLKPSVLPSFSFTTVGMGLLNLVHVGVSYLAFQLLPTGTALSLFYLYPIWNVLVGSLFFGESISWSALLLLAVALVGTYLLVTAKPSYETDTAKPSPETEAVKPSPETEAVKPFPTHGWVMGLLAGITETMIFAFVRWNKVAHISPWYTIHQLYPVGLVLLLFYVAFHPSTVDTTPTHWMALLGFNGVLGLTGYLARFSAIPKLPTWVYSLLSLLGVTFGYVWGHLFTHETITPRAVSGSALIVLSVAVLRYLTSS